jgi:hypothetical protein
MMKFGNSTIKYFYLFIIQGRHLQSNLLLRGHKSSKEHATIEFRDGRMFIKDHSMVGTFVNGRKYKNAEVEVHENAVVGFGYNHNLKEHMSMEKSSIYKVLRPEVVDLVMSDHDSDYDSGEVMIVDDDDDDDDDDEGNLVVNCQRGEGNAAVCDENESLKDLVIDESFVGGQVEKNDGRNQNDGIDIEENHENIGKNDENIQNLNKNIENSAKNIQNRPKNTEKTHQNIQNPSENIDISSTTQQNIEFSSEPFTITTQPEIIIQSIETFAATQNTVTPKQPQPPQRRLSMMIPPNINPQLLNIRKLPISSISQLAVTPPRNVDINSPVSSENCENLVELAKNLQGDRGIRTVVVDQGGCDGLNGNNDGLKEKSDGNGGKILEKNNEKTLEINIDKTLSQNIVKTLNQKIDKILEKNNEKTLALKITVPFPQISRTVREDPRIPVKKPLATTFLNSIYSMFSLRSEKPSETIQKPSENHQNIDDTTPPSPNPQPLDEDSLIEEIPSPKCHTIRIRRESIAKRPPKRSRKSNWSKNPGMVKVQKTVKRMKLAIAGGKLRSTNQSSPSTSNSKPASASPQKTTTTIKFPDINEPTEDAETAPATTAITPAAPRMKMSLKERRKSVYDQQNELISDHHTLSDKNKIIRRWKQQPAKIIEPRPMFKRKPGRPRMNSL